MIIREFKELSLTWKLDNTHAKEGDLVELVGLRHKHFIIRLQAGKDFQTHRGVLKHDEMIGRPWGSQIFSHLGSPFFLLQPSIADLIRDTKRTTQIMYPKEVGFILVNMGIGPGDHVLEAGTGSGALTSALAFAVGPEGHVTSYEVRQEMNRLARANLEKLGLADRVTLKVGDIGDGFEETGVDALFLDIPNPYDYMPQVREGLKPGGFFGSILPTMNQVSKLLMALRQNNFAFLEVCEIMLRYYKAEPERLRPTDRMVAHTGYLIFARPVIVSEDERGLELLQEANITVDKDAENE
jgi:tRNA (adenine57-N1/adenine58-N1)-methyltransferase catalytic subunit